MVFGIFKKSVPLNNSQLWMLAAAAPLSLVHDDSLDSIKVGMFGFACRNSMESQYGIENREDALATLSWLIDEGGHSTHFPNSLPGENTAQRQAILQKYHSDFSRFQVIAFDKIRASALARWCWKAKYLSEQEMWNSIHSSNVILQKTFSSWEELGRNWLAGYEVFRAGSIDDEFNEHLNWLLNDDESPWKTLAWNTPLDPSQA